MSVLVRPQVLDTFKLNRDGIYLKALHISRTLNALRSVGNYSANELIVEIYETIEKNKTADFDQRIHLVISSEDLSHQFSAEPLTTMTEPVLLQVVHTLRQPSGRGQQNFKWQSRIYWNEILRAISTPATDAISLNEYDHMVETSRFNLFFFDPKKDLVYTPALASGCIAGVYREWVMSRGEIGLPNLGIKSIQESEIHFSEVNQFQLFLANSVRGVLSAGLAT